MTPTPDSLTRQWFQEVWNEGREEAIDRLLAADSIVYGLGGTTDAPMVGPAAFRPVFHTFRGAFPGLTVTVERTYVDGDTCIACCRVRGRHTGDALGAPASGREIDFTGVAIIRARDGKLVEGWNVFDFLTMYQQIGWARTPVLPA
jgi:steroid delta-isomerase-like uncharacterized protein